MIQGALIAITIYALILLIRGRPLGKNAPDRAYAGYRWMGAFMLTAAPATLAAMVLVYLIYSLQHPELSEKAVMDAMAWPAIFAGIAMLVVYAVIGHFWERSLKRRYGLMAR